MRVLIAALAVCCAVVPARPAERAPAPVPKEAGPVRFSDIVATALGDAESLPYTEAANTVYLECRHLPPVERKELFAVTSYHVNGLSRGAKVQPLREVTPWLWALRTDLYHWDKKVWDDLIRVNTYYAIKVELRAAVPVEQPPVKKLVEKTRQVLRYDARGVGYYTTETYTEEVVEPQPAVVAPDAKKVKDVFVPAPWLPAKDFAKLVKVTGTATPIVRADQFLFQTLAQANRDGHGYYDFLGLGKKLADAEDLAALDRKTAIKRFRELAAVVNDSGVALQNRVLKRYNTLGGPWWQSEDVKASDNNQDAVVNLLEDFKPDAFEIVATLPNGMPFFFLANDKGERQDTAPDFIASHHNSGNNDKRVHVGYSCISCHTAGALHPIEDYMRRVYSPDTGLRIAALDADPKKAERIESVYLRPLKKSYDADTQSFDETIEEASGLKSPLLSKAVSRQWHKYIDDKVTVEMAAAECGVTVDDLRTKLREYGLAKKGFVDSHLAAYLVKNNPPAMRREHFESRFALLMLILGGVYP